MTNVEVRKAPQWIAASVFLSRPTNNSIISVLYIPLKNGGVVMPSKSKRAKLSLTDEQDEFLTRITQSRTASLREVERAKILLNYAKGLSISYS
ncbi:hypothetical protein IIA29_04765, partial [candidate division KSB1 bacterium]|nr:hypothetical protein [candidate division KSB1 bacterium]